MVLTMPRATSRKKRRIFQGKRQCNLSQFGYKKSSHCDAGRNKTDNNLYQFIFTPWPPPPWSPSSIVILSPGTSLKCWMCLNTLALIVFAFSSGADTADSVTLVTATRQTCWPSLWWSPTVGDRVEIRFKWVTAQHIHTGFRTASHRF